MIFSHCDGARGNKRGGGGGAESGNVKLVGAFACVCVCVWCALLTHHSHTQIKNVLAMGVLCFVFCFFTLKPRFLKIADFLRAEACITFSVPWWSRLLWVATSEFAAVRTITLQGIVVSAVLIQKRNIDSLG